MASLGIALPVRGALGQRAGAGRVEELVEALRVAQHEAGAIGTRIAAWGNRVERSLLIPVQAGEGAEEECVIPGRGEQRRDPVGVKQERLSATRMGHYAEQKELLADPGGAQAQE
ncbi:hypothetical protein CXB45_01910 [Corynebacterium mastitidis]|uniref:Uncharacterized protein n=1 Tax=Corynebacterium mastitidis TaxID=161890 RepID=A0A2N0X9R3_9CORY|nr:hypothetical protein CXB45_01910 [Corynebacterium mastitidis]